MRKWFNDYWPLLAGFLVFAAWAAVFVLAYVGVIDGGSSSAAGEYCPDTHGAYC